jgi:hypothetical protein
MRRVTTMRPSWRSTWFRTWTNPMYNRPVGPTRTLAR